MAGQQDPAQAPSVGCRPRVLPLVLAQDPLPDLGEPRPLSRSPKSSVGLRGVWVCRQHGQRDTDALSRRLPWPDPKS